MMFKVAFVALLVAVISARRQRAERLDHEKALTCGEAPTLKERASFYYQCDRQCRWYVDGGSDTVAGPRFSDRRIVGKMVDSGPLSTRMCCCYNQTGQGTVRLDAATYGVPSQTLLGADPKQPYVKYSATKAFQTDTTWSGSQNPPYFRPGFDCKYVCAERSSGELVTVTRSEADQQDFKTLHCGVCSTCSSMKDIEVLAGTRTWITEVMTQVSAKFAAPWGYGFENVTQLQQILFDVGFNVSMASAGKDRPTCMDCWTDNIMCDAAQCKSKCWTKFFNPAQTKQCIECDEQTCGAEFIKCAGANRRSSGIISDIARSEQEKCTAGVYNGATTAALPEYEKPSRNIINKAVQDVVGSA